MKILMVNKFLFRRGGSETYMLELADQLQKMGHEVIFFGMKHEKNTVGDARFGVREVNFHDKNLGRFLYPFRIIWSSDAAKKMKLLIAEQRPDIVHLNNFNFQITPSILSVIKKARIPIVMTLHDSQLICPSHTLYRHKNMSLCYSCKGHRFYNCTRYRCIHGSFVKSMVGSLEGYVHQWLKSYRHINLYISPSLALKQVYAEFGFDATKIEHLSNFALLGEIEPEIRESQQQYVLYFGRLSEEKGISVLLRAAEKLPQIQFVIAGTGPLVEQLSGRDNIEYVGFKTSNELITLIRNAIMTLCPSTCFENCPMSVLESMSVGVPVVGSDIGGIPELLDHGTCGMLVPPNNPTALVEAIQQLIDNPSMRAEMSQNGLKQVRNYGIDMYAQQMIRYYERFVLTQQGKGE